MDPSIDLTHSPRFSNGVGHEVKAAVVTHRGTRVEFLQVELLVVELSRRLWVRFDEHLTRQRQKRAQQRKGDGYAPNL